MIKEQNNKNGEKTKKVRLKCVCVTISIIIRICFRKRKDYSKIILILYTGQKVFYLL